jgi:hypothetical protein
MGRLALLGPRLQAACVRALRASGPSEWAAQGIGFSFFQGINKCFYKLVLSRFW